MHECHLHDLEEKVLVLEQVDLLLLVSAQRTVSLVQFLGLVPTLVGLQGHAQDFVGEADVVVHFGVAFIEAGSQALL